MIPVWGDMIEQILLTNRLDWSQRSIYQVTPVKEKFQSPGLIIFSTYLIKTDGQPAHDTSGADNSVIFTVLQHHNLEALWVHLEQLAGAVYQDTLDMHHLRHDAGQELSALQPPDNSPSFITTQASKSLSESKIWHEISRTSFTPAMLLAIYTSTSYHSFCSALCCVMFTIPTHSILWPPCSLGPLSQITYHENLKNNTITVDCACRVLFTERKTITKNRLHNPLQMCLFYTMLALISINTPVWTFTCLRIMITAIYLVRKTNTPQYRLLAFNTTYKLSSACLFSPQAVLGKTISTNIFCSLPLVMRKNKLVVFCTTVLVEHLELAHVVVS
jgi:hypothetical protein